MLALATANDVRDVRGIGEPVLNFLRQVRVAILSNSDVSQVRNPCASCIEAGFHCQRRETAEVLVAVETLLGNSEDDFTILHDGRRGIGVKQVEAQNEHELVFFLPGSLVWNYH